MKTYKYKPGNFPLLMTVHLSYVLAVHVHIVVRPKCNQQVGLIVLDMLWSNNLS